MIDVALIQRVARAVASRCPRHAVDAEDLAQESICAALAGRKSIKGPMQDLLRHEGWSDNHGFNARSRRRLSSLDRQVYHVAHPADNPEALFRRHQIPARVSEALNALPARAKTFVRLRYWDGLQIGEIAIAMNMHRPRVSEMQRRILDGLRGTIQ